jgi:hypothetical protein
MTDMGKWDHKDEWHRHGKDFLIVVRRHSVAPSSLAVFDEEGQHRWAVYAYIYPKHHLFYSFSGPDMWQPAATALPLHCGPSFLRWHTGDDGKHCSVQIGADYNHLYDGHFSHCAEPSEAWQVFADASELFEHLSVREVLRKVAEDNVNVTG